MSGLPPLIADWKKLKLDWGYLKAQTLQPRIIPAGGELQLPTEDHIFSYPEGVLLHFSATFDDPACGVRLELNPDLDTETFLTVSRLLTLGLVRPDNLFYVVIPPASAAGFYSVRVPSPWIFKDWMRLYLLNSDTVAHTCSSFYYHIAVLKDIRPDEGIRPLKEMARAQQMLELYPELREPLRRRLEDEAEQFIKDMKLRVKLEAG